MFELIPSRRKTDILSELFFIILFTYDNPCQKKGKRCDIFKLAVLDWNTRKSSAKKADTLKKVKYGDKLMFII